MEAFIHNTELVPTDLHDRIHDMDQIVIEKYQKVLRLEDQVDLIQQEQDKLDQEITEAFNHRNQIAQTLGEPTYTDFLSFLVRQEQTVTR